MDRSGIITSINARLVHLQEFLHERQRTPQIYLPLAGGPIDDAVIHDEAATIALGIQHLLRNGYQHLVFIRQWDDYYACQREQAFIDGLRKLGTAGGHLVLSPDPLTFPANLQCLRSAIGATPRRVGLLCAQDGLAAEVIDAALRFGWRIPEEVGVIGIDRLICDFQAVRLSSIDTDRRNLGRMAAERLITRLRGGLLGGITLIPHLGVVARDSTGVAKDGQDPLMLAALRHIERHLNDPLLSVDVLVEALGRSRRDLHDAFRQHLGRPVGDEITRQRLDLAQTLLRDTTLTLAAIADACGYSSAADLARACRRELGVPPSKLRTA